MNILMVGAKAQARYSFEIVKRSTDLVTAVFDTDPDATRGWLPIPAVGEDDFGRLGGRCDAFLVAIGGIERGAARVRFGRRLAALGLAPAVAIHETAFIAATAWVGAGLQTFPRATVCDFTTLGDYCILGTSSVVEHDCAIGHGVHVMSGAVVLGEVRVGDFVTIGANATVASHVRIGEGAIVAPGATVTSDLPGWIVADGHPARVVGERVRD